MVKKGVVDEIFSKARFSGESDSYIVCFRDFETIRETSLPRFIRESDNFQKIPSSRITMIKKNNTVLFEKNSRLDE
jgi:hypothetical protein